MNSLDAITLAMIIGAVINSDIKSCNSLSALFWFGLVCAHVKVLLSLCKK